MVICLSMNSHESFLKVFEPPNETFDIFLNLFLIKFNLDVRKDIHFNQQVLWLLIKHIRRKDIPL